ncbi:MAG: mechanosensitive ion channel [Candidatus Omnitrophica bacterium]|nr:mechanosensitive ion channel [Candidatus Omnitrophota bacterium]
MKVIAFLSILLASGQALAQAEIKGVKEVTVEQLNTAKSLLNMIVEFFIKYSFQVLGGIIVIAIGWWVARYVSNLVKRLLEKNKVDVTVVKFIVGAVKLLIISFAIVVALGKFGIEIAPLIAGVSVAGFGLSFALQGPLSNYASGVTLIFTKPFKVGDIIEVAGVTGEVRDMKLPRTELKTVDGETIVVPNRHIVGEIIQNYSHHKRLDINVGVSYKTNVQKAITTVAEVIKRDERIFKTKEPKVGISEFADSSINIYARAWCKQCDYWDVMFSINKQILDEFSVNNIEIPFPQRDVHLYNEGK